MSVDGVDLTRATHQTAATALKSAGTTVTLRLVFRPDEYSQLEDRIRERMSSRADNTLYVRSLVDWDPAADTGVPIPNRTRFLTLKFGDIVQLTSMTDEDWWQAKTVDHHQTLLIPSKTRLEKKLRLRASYEIVEQVDADYTRPVIILGPIRDKISEDLMREFPQSFGCSIRHTTRARRPGEVDGRDYHFVASRAAMEADIQKHKFIEAGQFKDNLYGTAVSSIRAVAENGKHCLLDVAGNAIKRLQSARIYPITILLKPSLETIMKINRNSPQEALKSQNQADQVETEYLEYLTAIVKDGSVEEIYEEVKQVIINHTQSIWVACSDKL